MEDSPLSIIASVTGILTFAAAILASIYVRYNTLRNGHMEMTTVLESVSATIEDARRWGQVGLESDLLNKIMVDLYSTELEILARCMQVYGTDLKKQKHSPGSDFSWNANNNGGTWTEVLQKWQLMQDQDQRTQDKTGILGSFRRIAESVSRYGESIHSLLPVGLDSSSHVLFYALRMTLTLGATPILLRWYRVRKEVLEMMQTRENLRSRLLLIQISAANSLARNQEAIIRDQNVLVHSLKTELSMIRQTAVYTKLCVEKITNKGVDEGEENARASNEAEQ